MATEVKHGIIFRRPGREVCEITHATPDTLHETAEALEREGCTVQTVAGKPWGEKGARKS